MSEPLLASLVAFFPHASAAEFAIAMVSGVIIAWVLVSALGQSVLAFMDVMSKPKLRRAQRAARRAK